MAKQLVSELRSGEGVKACFQVINSQLYEYKNKGGRYAILQLSDRTGVIRGVCWENGEKIHFNVPVDSIVNVEGRVETFNGQPQLVVKSVTLAGEEDYESTDFIQTTQCDVDKMFDYMMLQINGMKNPNLKNLLLAFFGDPEFAAVFKAAPAAKSIHHSYLGGLLEHTSNCLKLGVTLCELYPQLRRELFLTSIMLHDIGKTVELEFTSSLNYTDRGRLLGHIVIGSQMILDKMRTIKDFPEPLELELLHLVVSHHGENSTGSPKRPKTPEACALHYLENLDAQTRRFIQIIESANLSKDNKWTPYDRLLDRYLFLGFDDFEEDGGAEEE